MKITARPFAKDWTVVLTATIAFLVWLWKAIDNVSVAEFILQKTVTQETVFRYLAHPKAPDIAFLIVFGLLLLSIFFQIERDKSKQDEGEQKESEPNPFETPEYDLTPSKKQPLAEAQTKTIEPPEKSEKVKPVLVVEDVKIVQFNQTENKEVITNANYWNTDAFVVDFSYLPAENSFPDISIKAKIEFQDTDKKRLHLVKVGFWQETLENEIHLTTGGTGSLTVAVLQSNKRQLKDSQKLYSYEYGTYYQETALQTVPDPTIRELNGKDFIVNVELIIKRFDDFIANPKFSFSISLEPEPKFEKIETKDES